MSFSFCLQHEIVVMQDFLGVYSGADRFLSPHQGLRVAEFDFGYEVLFDWGVFVVFQTHWAFFQLHGLERRPKMLNSNVARRCGR